MLCLVTLVPTDPDVAVLGEELVVALLLHHFLIDGIHNVGGHHMSWETSAPCISSLRCVVQVELALQAIFEIISSSVQLPTDLILDVLLVRFPLGVIQKPHAGNFSGSTGLSLWYCLDHYWARQVFLFCFLLSPTSLPPWSSLPHQSELATLVYLFVPLRNSGAFCCQAW